uniref:Uncharacterized protein n=1 Tax=Thermogemmatispora argillosa TaxID=2045280 RepID=A0A455SWX3_9CHLR|nr:hypothetical protein KTA_03990 [Thermogemmatispora argillosa]
MGATLPTAGILLPKRHWPSFLPRVLCLRFSGSHLPGGRCQRLQEAWELWRRWQPRLEWDRFEADEQGQRLWAETAGGWLIAQAASWEETE